MRPGAAEARKDRLEHADGSEHGQRQVDAVKEPPAKVAGGVGQIKDGRQKHEPGDQEDVLAAAPAQHGGQPGQRQQQLWGEREKQTEGFRRQGVLGVEGPALDLWVADEGQVAIKDVGRRDRKRDDERKPAARCGRPHQQCHRGGAAHEDGHLGMDRSLAKPAEPRKDSQDKAPSLYRLQCEHRAGGGENSRPREVRQGQDRVEGGELRHAPVERVGDVAEDHRVAERLDHVPHAQADRAKEESEEPRGAVGDEVVDECPDRCHQREGGRHHRQVEHHYQRQIEQRGNVPQGEPEHEQIGGRARLGGVSVGPRPCSLPSLPHLGEVCVRVIAQVEEAHEHLAVGLHCVGIEVRNRGDDCDGQPREEGHPPVTQRCGRAVAGPLYLLRVHRLTLSRKTVSSARRTSPCDTFEAPATRSSNRIGVSTTRYPSLRAR